VNVEITKSGWIYSETVSALAFYIYEDWVDLLRIVKTNF